MRPRVPAGLAVLVTALAVEVGLHTMPLPRLARRLGVALDLESDAQAEPGPVVLPGWARPQVEAVDRLLARWPYGDTCLRRSLVLGHRLRGRGPVLRIGVRRRPDGRFAAHAWLEVDGRSLDPDSERYAVLAGGPPVPDATGGAR